MSKLHDTARAFVTGTGPASSGAFTVTPNEAYSYRAKIAYRDDDGIINIATESYSVTTAKHRNAIIRAAEDAHMSYRGTTIDGAWDYYR